MKCIFRKELPHLAPQNLPMLICQSVYRKKIVFHHIIIWFISQDKYDSNPPMLVAIILAINFGFAPDWWNKYIVYYRIFRDIIASFISTTRMLLHPKKKVIASSGNFQRPISSDFKFDKVVHWRSGQQIGTFWPLVECLKYAVHALFTHRFERPPSWKMRMMTSSNGTIFRVTVHLCGEFTGPRWNPHRKASDAEL